MAIRLTIVDPRDQGVEHRRGFVQDRVVLGRARTCDVFLPDMAVSTRHAEIRLDGNDYKVVDLGSLNGTFVDDKRLVSHRPRLLRNGDVIEIAPFSITFQLGVSPGPPAGRDEAVCQARELLAALLARGPDAPRAPAVIVLRGPGRASRYELVEAPCTVRIGRAKSNDIWIEDRDVSREHAELHWDGAKVTIRDLGDTSGVIVGDERISRATLAPGDHFVVGNTTLALEHPADDVLKAIQEAPEEETSSFSLDRRSGGVEPRRATPMPADDVERAAERPEDPPPAAPLPVGPADPLDDPRHGVHIRTTREIPRPPANERGDLGLIVVGAIIIAAAVAGLVYLFG